MKNKIVVNIGGQQYTMVAVEGEDYVRRCATLVDEQLEEIMGSRLSLADSAVLAAMNVADRYYKEVETSENLRRQLKESMEEAGRLKGELSEAKREIFKLQTRK